MDKELDNTKTADAVKTTPKIKIFGNPDAWQLICKASGKNWMKSIKKMEVETGYVWQVSTEFRDEDGNVTACAEALTFEPK